MYKSNCKSCMHCIHLYSCWQFSIRLGGDLNYKDYCPCQKYIPSDNLEYLEYLNEQKNKVS